MTYFTRFLLALSTLPTDTTPKALHDILARQLHRIAADLLAFQTKPLSPTATYDLELTLAKHLREIGRELLQWLYNRLEGNDPTKLPSHLRLEGEDYRIVRKKTPHAIDTRFGSITLLRHLYRPVARDSAEKSIAPLERILGVVEGTTPALADAAARCTAEAGATQRRVQEQLHAQHGVTIGTKRLRALIAKVSGKMSEARQEFQVARILDLLKMADQSSGRTKPVLSVSRDGICLRENQHGHFEVASAGTMTVFDRRGRRLGTVYLALAPEWGQHQLTDQLTRLIEAVLRQWAGTLPRLAYITDAGENETQYYNRVLKRMVHPRTGEPLLWQRIIDFYHAMERVWKLAEVLFGDDTRSGRCWARKMGKLLKKANGPYRVLHSAGALKARLRLNRDEEKEYEQACNYLRQRTKWMQYSEYARLHLPLGSGIVEAACKTIFTQRLKLSGMRWTKEGAQVILDLRVILLSGVWDVAYRHTLESNIETSMLAPGCPAETHLKMAA
jgi:hypothetical protein